ncbi:MAG: secondary thiamine-phosphate synthase enzyme YjbQ [Deltaproteobacteria bacterium]|nr:secondary thiamine-phosphate synthase enzyme YjbQ [Deltaproteobacteria bacterium]
MPVSIQVTTRSRNQMKDITGDVQKAIAEAGASDGLCTIYVPHTTAGVTINEGADPAVCQDILDKLEDLVPPNAGYRHMEGNADSHVKASLMGSSASVMVENGRLVLGTWQKIFFCEFDGPRTRKVYVSVSG